MVSDYLHRWGPKWHILHPLPGDSPKWKMKLQKQLEMEVTLQERGRGVTSGIADPICQVWNVARTLVIGGSSWAFCPSLHSLWEERFDSDSANIVIAQMLLAAPSMGQLSLRASPATQSGDMVLTLYWQRPFSIVFTFLVTVLWRYNSKII